MQNLTETKKIHFPGKWTQKGAQLQYHLFDQTGQKINSQTINESWTGMNWNDEFVVEKNRKYILVVVCITNTHHHQCRIDQLIWNGEKVSITPLADHPFNFRTLCPKCFGRQ